MIESAPPLASILLEESARAGAAAADVFLKRSVARHLGLPSGSTGRSVERGVALRLFVSDGRSAIAAATLPPEGDPGGEAEGSARAIAAALVRRAVAAAALASPAPLLSLPGAAAADGRGLGLFDPDIEGPVEMIRAAAGEIHAFASEAAAGASAETRLEAVTSTVHLANSAGFAGSFRHTLARLDLTLSIARGGASASAHVVRAARSLRGLAADAAALEAASLLEERLEPRLAPSGIHEVLLSPRAAAELTAALAACVCGSGEEGVAWSPAGAPRRGERIGSNAITVTDDGRLPGGVASAPFDGEGTRTRRTVILERGTARETLRDLEAGASGAGSTGNGIRASFREAPSLRPTNLFINPGHEAPGDLLASIRQGIRISALGRIPPSRSPDAPFAVPFTGRWIHGGRTGAPLGGGFLAGNLREILTEVEAAASDLAFSHRRGSFGSPTLLLRRAPVRSA